jgi:ABC-type glycerol-3-phosphate transport system substrate-binding protein
MEKKTQRGIITAAVVLVAVAVAMKFILPKKSNGGNISGGDNAGGGNTGGFSPVNTNLDYRSLANQLFDAFDGYGTAENKVKEIFKLLKSNADYDSLKAAYGVREVSSGTWNIFQSNFEGDMPATVKHELDDNELAEVNQILASNGVTRTI